MKPDPALCNRLKPTRTRLGLSQQDLANLAGVSRQTISGVEAGHYAPSATIALRLARSLNCRVEDLFWLEPDWPEVEAVAAQPSPAGQHLRLSLAQIGGRWVAQPLLGRDAFRTELIPADGEGECALDSDRLRVRLWNDPQTLGRTVVLAGCSPALSLLARAAERWHPELRVHWRFANSMTALRSLVRGEVHIAGMHLYSAQTGEHNAPYIQPLLAGQKAVLINLGVWAEGLLVESGNPMGLRSAADLAQTGVTIVNREPGSGCRQVLEQRLAAERVPPQAVQGFEQLVGTHLAVAEAVATGRATAGVSTAAIATAFGLGFIPWHQARYDLVILQPSLDEAPVQQLLSALNQRWIQAQLAALGGHDIDQTGEVMATLE